MSEPRLLNGAQALLEATDICLARDPRVFVIGEGVADPKGIFGTTTGLAEKYGANRVLEMPLAENGFTGMAIGAALLGQRPILIHQRVDFSLLSLEQLFNNAAKTCYVTRGRHHVPLIVRMIIGRGWGQGPAHSQSLETIFSYFPGLKVVMPTTAREAKGMLIAAVEDENPVIFLEHRWIHYATGEVPAGYEVVPIDGPRIVRKGSDITIVATSYMVFEALRAATALAEIGIEAEVIDLAVLRPLNLKPIIASVRRTGRLITVDTGFRVLGLGAEITATIAEEAFSDLRRPPIRLGLSDHPTPSSRSLLTDYYPTALQILDSVAKALDIGAERLAPARKEVVDELAKLPGDIPNPAFRGPF